MDKANSIVKIEVEIQGMTCESCAADIAEELYGVPGVLKVNIANWKSGRGEILALSAVDNRELSYAVEEAGYSGTVQKRYT